MLFYNEPLIDKLDEFGVVMEGVVGIPPNLTTDTLPKRDNRYEKG